MQLFQNTVSRQSTAKFLTTILFSRLNNSQKKTTYFHKWFAKSGPAWARTKDLLIMSHFFLCFIIFLV